MLGKKKPDINQALKLLPGKTHTHNNLNTLIQSGQCTKSSQ